MSSQKKNWVKKKDRERKRTKRKIEREENLKATENTLSKNSNQQDLIDELRQEAHGPHRSPEKTVQINKHMIIS